PTMLMPWRASRSAICLPIPRLTPVTSATFPLVSIVVPPVNYPAGVARLRVRGSDRGNHKTRAMSFTTNEIWKKERRTSMASATAAAGHRGGAGGLRGAVAVADAGGEYRHLARQMFAPALGTFRLRVAAGDQRFERPLAAFTSIFVDWHLLFFFHRLRVLDQH